MKRKNFLVCKNIKFYSELEKEVFFEFINRIKSIVDFEKKGDELFLYFKSRKIPDKDLRALIGLFDRFKIDMKQLKMFLNENNKKWFEGDKDDIRAYWYEKVFG